MATLSCLRACGLAADLDRAMTVEKRTSCGPTSRRVIVVLVSGSVAEVAA
jgi:hypothetical protein